MDEDIEDTIAPETEIETETDMANNNQPRRKWVAGLKWYVMELIVPVLCPEVLEGSVEDYLEAMVDTVVEEAEETCDVPEEPIDDDSDETTEEEEGNDVDAELADAWEALEAGEDNDATLEALERIASKEPR